ncbi:MAG: prenyltransferase [Candidatus Hydrogenedentota bacterium]
MDGENCIKLLLILKKIRYRFFLFAGIFPYLIGQSIAYSSQKSLNIQYFYLGFLGIFLVLIGVELFNEYFDSFEGGDRIFIQVKPSVNPLLFLAGLLVFILAFIIGVFLTIRVGSGIIFFSIIGFLAAYFYVGPPIRWAYRGFGELVISLSYGPFMVLGSYYLQTKRIGYIPLFVSFICGLVLFALAILNEIPDYYQDRLVGKKNLVVRLGQLRSIHVTFCVFTLILIFIVTGLILKILPLLVGVVFFLVPWQIRSLSLIYKNYEDPQIYKSTINSSIYLYLTISITVIIGYIIR